MKKNCITFVLIGIILLSVLFFALDSKKTETEYLRIHVRANSNLEQDQLIKYELKDKIVAYLTPYVADLHTKSQAISFLNGKISSLEDVCNNSLKSKGFNYKAKVEIKTEYFPTRVYEEVTLEAGYYDSIIVSLGEAKGENWWCVVYPPLCFVKSAPIKYRSKILQIIEKFKEAKWENL